MHSSDTLRELKQSPSVYSLPPEILGHIFELLVDLEPPRSSVLPDCLGWFRVTHVSHYFRSAALAYPALWDIIPFSLGENWARLALERSQNAELVVRHAIYPGTRGSDVLTETNFLEDVLDRVRVIELSGAQETLGAVLARLRKPTAQLKILSMQADRVPGPNEDWPFTIPRSLFQVNAPDIRELRLDGVFLPELSAQIPSLRHLSICLRQSTQEYPRLRDVYDTLRVMPNLRTLVLQHCLPQGEIRDLEPIILPSLESLELVDADSAITRFIDAMTFPFTASLDIQCSMGSRSEEQESIRAQNLVVSCVARCPCPHSMVFASDGRGLEVSVSGLATVDPNVYVFIHSSQPDWDYQRLVHAAFDAVSSPSLQSIELRFPIAPSGINASWKELPGLISSALSRFDYMQSVSVTRALGWAMCATLTTGPSDAFFPRLRELTLAVADFNDPVYYLDSMLETLARSRQGVLEKLRLVGCVNLGQERLMSELRTLLDVEVLDAEVPLVLVEN